MSGICIQCQTPCHPMGDLCDNCANQLEPIASLESTDGGYSFNHSAFHSDGMLDEQAEADKLHQHERQMDIECYHNIYKSIHGHRPRHIDFDAMSDDELQEAIKAL